MYWNFIDPWGEEHDIECATAEKAEEWAQDWWAGRAWEDGCNRNGETAEAEGELVQYQQDDGDPEEISRQKIALFYEHYHGDYAEHNTMGM